MNNHSFRLETQKLNEDNTREIKKKLKETNMKLKQQELSWLQSVYKNCETVGISRFIIERFEKYYLVERDDRIDEFVSNTKRT